MSYSTRIFNEGWLAFGLGLNLSDNPYPLQTDSYYDWNEGWRDAEDDAFSDDDGE